MYKTVLSPQVCQDCVLFTGKIFTTISSLSPVLKLYMYGSSILSFAHYYLHYSDFQNNV